MNPLRYKLMISYLPGMATIVNSFQSPDVQRAVFDSLMEALNCKLESEVAGSGAVTTAKPRLSHSSTRIHSPSNLPESRDSARFTPDDDIAHELAEGDSIHSMNEHQEALP